MFTVKSSLKLSVLLIAGQVFLAAPAFAVEIEPTPKSTSQEKVEKIQRTGGALKVEDKAPTNFPDPAMEVINTVTEENRSALPVKEPEHYWGPLVQVGLPHPLNLGLLYLHSSKLISAEVSFGQFSFDYQDAKAKIENSEANLRYHPFASAFFVGLGYGKQKINIKQTENVSGQEVEAEVEFKSDYVLPHFGWMSATKDGGFFWAFEIGWQSPSNGKTKLTTSVDLSGDPDYDELIDDVRDTVDKAGKKSLPNIALIKFGWLF